MTETASSRPRVQPATIALGAAALIAVGVIGYSTLVRGNAGAEPENNSAVNAASPRRNPDDHAGWFALGMAWRDMEDFQQASGAFRRAMELQPRNVDYNNYLA